MQPSQKVKQAKEQRQKIAFDIGDLREIFETTDGGARKIMRAVKQGASDPDGKWSYPAVLAAALKLEGKLQEGES